MKITSLFKNHNHKKNMNKTFLLVTTFLCFSTIGWAETVAKQPQGWRYGSGGIITNLAELRWLSEESIAWGENWELGADIDASDTKNWNRGEGFEPIGGSIIKFKGTFDGKGYTISNLYFNRPTDSYIGLFGQTKDATIHDVRLASVQITGSEYIGGIVGKLDGTKISNCSVTGVVKGEGDKIGGLVGELYNSTLSQSFSIVDVIGEDYVGGLVGIGSHPNSKINNCFATGEVTANKYVGGVIGECKTGTTITNCYAMTKVSGKVYTGAFVGYCHSGASVFDCFIDKVEAGSVDVAGKNYSNKFTVTEITDPKNFALESTFPNWDFEDIWKIAKVDEISTTHAVPYLKSFLFDYTISLKSDTDFAYDVFKGPNYVNNGDEVTLEVVTKIGYKFTGWKLGDKIISTDNPYTFTYNASSSQTYVATFKEDYKFNGGDGSETSPYQITTLEQLASLSNVPSLWDKHFELVADVDATGTKNWNGGKGFHPIGDANFLGDRENIPFKGAFNGNNHMISNLYINRPEEDYVGLFGVAQLQAIKNLGLVDVEIVGKMYVGGLIGEAGNLAVEPGSTIVSNCYVKGKVKGDTYVGGLIGTSYGTNVEKCHYEGSAVGNAIGGGLIGDLRNKSKLELCYINGDASFIGNSGGLVGQNTGSIILNCFAAGNVYGHYSVGGLVGENNGTAKIENCYAFNFNNGISDKGGLVGRNVENAVIISSYFDTEATNMNGGIGTDENNQVVKGLKNADFANQG